MRSCELGPQKAKVWFSSLKTWQARSEGLMGQAGLRNQAGTQSQTCIRPHMSESQSESRLLSPARASHVTSSL